jgi:hypothetical protein
MFGELEPVPVTSLGATRELRAASDYTEAHL